MSEPVKSVILGNVAAADLGKNEDWPTDAKLFQPYDVEQILLPDNANCLTVYTFLKMCKLPITLEFRANAEYMSPTGQVPFIKCGLHIVAELDHIVTFVGNKNISLTEHLDTKQKSDMRADMSLINTVLSNAELYLTWVDPKIYEKVTKPRYGSVHPWPLNHILTYLKRRAVINKLKNLKWMEKDKEQVYAEINRTFKNLSYRLGKDNYFFGKKPTELDALVFGHVYTIITTNLPDKTFAEIIKDYPNIVAHCDRIHSQFSPTNTINSA